MKMVIRFFSKPVLRTWAWVFGLLAIVLSHTKIAYFITEDKRGLFILSTILATIGAIVWYVYVLRFVSTRTWKWLQPTFYTNGHVFALVGLLLLWLKIGSDLLFFFGGSTRGFFDVVWTVVFVVFLWPLVPFVWSAGYLANTTEIEYSWHVLGYDEWSLFVVVGAFLAITIVPIVWGIIFSFIRYLIKKIRAREKE